MKNNRNKSAFDKLYLIQPEMYNRIVPRLNEVEKQELNDINEKNAPSEENRNDETFEQKNDDVEEMDNNVEQVKNAPDLTPKVEEPIIDNPTIPVVEKTPEKTFEKGVKKFPCEICVDKKFTTIQSLKRHTKTFHRKKHSIKETQVNPEVNSEVVKRRKKVKFYPEVNPEVNPEVVKPFITGGKAPYIESDIDFRRRYNLPKKKTLKRKFQHNPGEFHFVRDNLAFSKDEPVIKLPKRDTVNWSKIPTRAKVKRKFSAKSQMPYASENKSSKRKFDDVIDDFERDERLADEPVEKLPKYNWLEH